MTEQQIYMNHAGEWWGHRGIWFAESPFETRCNTEPLKSMGAPREYLQKMSCLSVFLPQLAVKDISLNYT